MVTNCPYAGALAVWAFVTTFVALPLLQSIDLLVDIEQPVQQRGQVAIGWSRRYRASTYSAGGFHQFQLVARLGRDDNLVIEFRLSCHPKNSNAAGGWQRWRTAAAFSARTRCSERLPNAMLHG
jgi:hypothetical protein